MKKVLYIHQYFVTPKQAGGTRSYWFSKELIKNNFKVVMLTSGNKQDKLIERKIVDGIEVIYIRNSYDNSFGILKRLYSFTRFMIISTTVALKQKEVDITFATSTPLTVGFPALFLKWFKGIDYIFEVRDLWPEVPVQMGAINNKLIAKILYRFERLIYKKSKHIIALSPGMREGVLKQGVSLKKVSLIPNMSKTDKFYLRIKNTKTASGFNINLNNFNVIHFGAMGIANGLEYITDAAVLLKKENVNDISFVFLGNGKMKESLIKTAREYELNNIIFIDSQPMDTVSEIVNLCDCSIVSFADIPILKTNSPNKLFDSLSAEKPVIVNSAGWTKEMVEKNNCGAYVDPKNPKELSELLKKWKNSPELMLTMGKNSRKLAESVYDKSILSKKFVDIIKSNV